MRSLVVLGILIAISSSAFGQIPSVEGQIFVADRGTAMNGSNGGIRRYTQDGTLIETLANNGSGAVRGIETDYNNDLFVARGNNIEVYRAPNHTPDTTFANGTQSQDVAVHPITGNIWCSFGTNAGSAEVREYNTNGLLVRTITDVLLVHPRSLAFNAIGTELYIANAGANNILFIDTEAASPNFADVGIYADLSPTTTNYSPISVAADASGVVYVSGDWALDNTIFQMAGAAGSPAITTFSNYGAIPAFNSPGGMKADSYGNLYVTCRDQNMATPGLYIYNIAAAALLQVPFTGPEHLRPIDIAFSRHDLDLTVTSPDGLDGVNVPQVDITFLSAALPAPVTIDISSPDFGGRPYGIAMSLLTDSLCNMGQPTLPLLFGIPLALTEPRILPLNPDALFALSLSIISSGGSGPLDAASFGCPGASGSVTHLFGNLNSGGKDTALLQLPALACLPLGTTIYIGFAAAIVDAQTGPLGLALVSNKPTCLRIEVVL